MHAAYAAIVIISRLSDCLERVFSPGPQRVFGAWACLGWGGGPLTLLPPRIRENVEITYITFQLLTRLYIPF